MNDALAAMRVFLVLAGPFAGDFVATLAVAWPRLPALTGRSHCGLCGAPIATWHKIPVVSWLAHRGLRRCCGGQIPIAYLIGEVAGIACGLAAAAASQPAAEAWMFAVGLTLIYIALVDLRRFTIPLGGSAALSVEAVLAIAAAPSIDDRLVRLASGASLALTLVVLRYLSGRKWRAGLRVGEIALAGLLGVLASWPSAVPTIALAVLAPLVLQWARKQAGPVPFGFWLNLSAGLCLLSAQSNLLFKQPPWASWN